MTATFKRFHSLAFRCCAVPLLLLAGCGDPDVESSSGTIALNLQTADGRYELVGSVTFQRLENPGFSITEQLAVGVQTQSVTLPAGSYRPSLDEGWQLLRLSDSGSRDVTQSVESVEMVGTPESAPDVITVQPDSNVQLTISLELAEDADFTEFATGSATLAVEVQDDGLSCGGCGEGELCLDSGDSTRCVVPCDPDAANDTCPEGTSCGVVYVLPDRREEPPRALDVCL